MINSCKLFFRQDFMVLCTTYYFPIFGIHITNVLDTINIDFQYKIPTHPHIYLRRVTQLQVPRHTHEHMHTYCCCIYIYDYLQLKIFKHAFMHRFFFSSHIRLGRERSKREKSKKMQGKSEDFSNFWKCASKNPCE